MLISLEINYSGLEYTDNGQGRGVVTGKGKVKKLSQSSLRAQRKISLKIRWKGSFAANGKDNHKVVLTSLSGPIEFFPFS